jgi:AcrR family transcriptional regulator
VPPPLTISPPDPPADRAVNTVLAAGSATPVAIPGATARRASDRMPTPLQRQRGGPDHQRPTPIDAFRLARRMVLNSQRLDMRALADDLGVNRVTLYRWVGRREQLLVEVLWSMTQWRFDEIWGEVMDKAGPRVPEVLRRWVQITVSTPGMRHLLYDQSELAMKLLTLDSGGFQPRLLALVRGLIGQDVDDGRVASPLDLDELAFAVMRICESYIYLPVILNHETDPDAMFRVLGVLLPPPTRTAS